MHRHRVPRRTQGHQVTGIISQFPVKETRPGTIHAGSLFAVVKTGKRSEFLHWEGFRFSRRLKSRFPILPDAGKSKSAVRRPLSRQRDLIAGESGVQLVDLHRSDPWNRAGAFLAEKISNPAPVNRVIQMAVEINVPHADPEKAVPVSPAGRKFFQ